MRKNNDAIAVLALIFAIVGIAIWIYYAREVWSSDLPWWIKLKLM